MLSLENIAAVKSAVVTSLNPELKREILCAPGSEYDISKSENQFSRKQQWNDIIDKKAREILSRQTLPKDLLDKVVALLPAIGLKMLIWAEYHEGTLRLTRDFSLQFLRYSHFTEQGVVDTRNAAEDLMNSENLNAKQKYKIACIYFFSDHMNSLYKEIVKDGIGGIYDAAKFLEKPRVVKFWTCVQWGEHFSKHMFYKNRIVQAMASGCKPAVQCLWEKWKGSKYNFVEKTTAVNYPDMEIRPEDSDWIIFRDRRYDDAVDNSWVPTDYYDDTCCFIFSKVVEIPQLGIRELDYILHRSLFCYYLKKDLSSVLELFLRWPHQDHFLATATRMWECISGKAFSAVLLKICDYIEPRKDKNIRYGEEKCYDYRHLLKEFWRKSPDRCKRYFFGSMDEIYLEHEEAAIHRDPFGKPATNLLVKLLSLKKFTREDEEIIRSVLSGTTNEEMANLMSVAFWKDFFVKAMKEEKFEIFDRFLRACFQSQAKAEEFKEKLKLEDEVDLVCKSFLSYNKWNAIQSFIERISLTEIELERLKFDLIYSPSGKAQCWKLISSEEIEAFERFISWFLPSEEKARAFKKQLAARYRNTCTTPHLEEKTVLELVNHFRESGNADEKYIQQCKESVAHVFGVPICEELISSHSSYIVNYSENSPLFVKSDFRGGQWSKVDKFLSSLLPPDKIVDFKKRIYEKDAVRILASLIKAKQWSEADKFCEWLELPESEISRMKKKTLNESDGTGFMFHDLVFTESDDAAKKSEKIDAMLRWHLTDTKAVLEFRDSFLREHAPYSEYSLLVFEMSIEKYLGELSGRRVEPHSRSLNDGSVKRKSSTSSPPKKVCLPQPRQENKQEAEPVSTDRRQSQQQPKRANKK